MMQVAKAIELVSAAEFNEEIAQALRKFLSFLKPLRGNLRLQLHSTLSPRESLITG